MLSLVVYVNDMKIAGRKAEVAEAWKRLRAEVKMDPPEDAGRYLGCARAISYVVVDGFRHRCMSYNMEDFADGASSMKVLCGARMSRFDLLRAICTLACCITKWDTGYDRRLMCYI